MPLFSWLINANLWYLTCSSLNGTIHNQTHLTLSTLSSSSLLERPLRHDPKRHVLWHRQSPTSVLTVTATVTLTVTDTVFTPFAADTIASDSPSASIVRLPTITFTSETPSLPEFVTATNEAIPSSSFSNFTPLPSSSPSAFSTGFDPTLPATSTSPAFLPSSIISISASSPTMSPTSVSTFENTLSMPIEPSSIAFSSNTTNTINPSLSGGQAQNSGRPNRLTVPLIVVTVIGFLGFLLSFLACLIPYLRNARRRQLARNGSMFEEYTTSARTFEPNASGGLNYQRSLSRKRNRRGRLVEVVEIPDKIRPSDKSKIVNGDLWLPPTSAGPGLTRPS